MVALGLCAAAIVVGVIGIVWAALVAGKASTAAEADEGFR